MVLTAFLKQDMELSLTQQPLWMRPSHRRGTVLLAMGRAMGAAPRLSGTARSRRGRREIAIDGRIKPNRPLSCLSISLCLAAVQWIARYYGVAS